VFYLFLDLFILNVFSDFDLIQANGTNINAKRPEFVGVEAFLTGFISTQCFPSSSQTAFYSHTRPKVFPNSMRYMP